MRTSIIAIAFAFLLSGGCYHHVVDAEGIGSEDVETYEPNDPQENQSDLEVDKAEDPPGRNEG